MEEEFGLENENLQIRIGNFIYFYDEICPQSALRFTSALNDANNYLEDVQKNVEEKANDVSGERANDYSIKLFIDSPGGNGVSAMTMLSAMDMSPYPIDTFVIGSASSAATLIACYGRYRYMYEYATYLIHQPSMGMGGKYADVVSSVKYLSTIYDFIIDIYKKNSKMNEKQIRELMSQESYFGAEEALKYGLIDKIVEMPKRKFRKNG